LELHGLVGLGDDAQHIGAGTQALDHDHADVVLRAMDQKVRCGHAFSPCSSAERPSSVDAEAADANSYIRHGPTTSRTFGGRCYVQVMREWRGRSVIRLHQVRPGWPGLERIAEILSLAGDLSVAEFHDAYGVGRDAVIAQHELGDPDVTVADDPLDGKAL